MFSERSERSTSETDDALGSIEDRARAVAELRALGAALDPTRIAIASSRASAYLALFYVLADLADEIIVLSPGDSFVSEVATISGLHASSIAALDARDLFEATTERTRAIAITRASTEMLELLAELALPIVIDATEHASRSTIATHPIFGSERAPLAIEVRGRVLAICGPANVAEPLLARLEPFASVFFESSASASRPA